MIANTKYNEFAYAKQIYQNGFRSKYYGYELRILAIYLRDTENKSQDDIKEFLVGFCQKYYPYYTYSAVYKLINRAISASKNKDNILIDIPEIVITEPEYDKIVSYGLNNKLTILLFSMLVRKKLSRIMYEEKNKKPSDSLYLQMTNEIISDIRLMAGIGSKKILMDMMQKLYSKGAISAYYNALVRLDFMENLEEEEQSSVILRIKNYDDVSLYVRELWGDQKIKRCKKCEEPFCATNNRQLFCKRHQGYESVIHKKADNQF